MAMGEPFASADWIGFAAGAFSPWCGGNGSLRPAQGGKALEGVIGGPRRVDHGFTADGLNHGCRRVRAGGSQEGFKEPVCG